MSGDRGIHLMDNVAHGATPSYWVPPVSENRRGIATGSYVPVFNSQTYLGFLKQLVRQYKGRKIHLIADNAEWHKSPEILEWVQANEDKIELHFLPKYSPDLNAAEYLWKETRRRATHNRFFPNEDILREKLFRRFNRFQGNPASLRNLIAPFV